MPFFFKWPLSFLSHTSVYSTYLPVLWFNWLPVFYLLTHRLLKKSWALLGLTSSPGLLFKQLGLNLFTYSTWMAHLMLRWWSWLLTLRINRSFWGKWNRINMMLQAKKKALVHIEVFTTVRYCSILPSTRPSWNWSLYCGKPISSSHPVRYTKYNQIKLYHTIYCGVQKSWSSSNNGFNSSLEFDLNLTLCATVQ